MNERKAHSSSLGGELGSIAAIGVALLVIGGVLYWWGSQDESFSQRKFAFLMHQLDVLDKQRPEQSGMELYVSYAQEASATRRLLTCSLDSATWLSIARRHTNAIFTLLAMGNFDTAREFSGLCESFARSSDPQVRELGLAAKCAMEFEHQIIYCRQRHLADQLLSVAEQAANGDQGQQIAQRLREHLATEWRLLPFGADLVQMSRSLPPGNTLARRINPTFNQLIALETRVAEDAPHRLFADWLVQVEQLASHYPNNEEIGRRIGRHCDRLIDAGCYDEANQVLDAALAGYRAELPVDPRVHVAPLVDRRLAGQVGLDRLPDRIRRESDQPESLVDSFRIQTQQLQDQESVTAGVLDRLLGVPELFENKQQYDALQASCAALLDYLGEDPTAHDRLANYCAATRRRAALVGQPFQMPSSIAVDQPVDFETLKDRVVAVVFWSAQDSESLNLLKSLNQLYDAHHAKGFELVAINVDQDQAIVQKMVAEWRPAWQVIAAAQLDGTGRNPLAVEYGIEKTPYLMLVGRDGIVVDVALDSAGLWARCVKLIPELNARGTLRPPGSRP